MNLVRYGIKLPDKPNFRAIAANALLTELWFFANLREQSESILATYTGPGVYGHAVNAANIAWRQKGREVFQWHPDLEEALRGYCEAKSKDEILLTGPGSGGKTFGAALYAILFWMADTQNSGVLCCSTTKGGLKKRIWGEIRKLYLAIQASLKPSNLLDSQTCIQSSQGEDQRGLFGIAVAEGSPAKAMGRIIGFHPPRLLVIVDELTDVSWAVVDACCNLSSGKRVFQFIGIGNASSFFDSHGKMCEPKDGWSSITVDSERWETKRGGTCFHFDAFKNPNITSGKVIYEFLIKPEDIEETIANDGENSPKMWRFRRGFWCPEGTVNVVLSESMISNCMCLLKDVSWESGFRMYAGLDPAFEGGDRCILRFGKVGKDSQGSHRLLLDDIVAIKTDATKFHERPLEYQIADRVKEECEQRGVAIDCFAMDITGAGAGLAAIISEEWGPGFHKVHFSAAPSDLPAGPTDPRPCNEVYHNKVTELWYSIRASVLAFHIRGLDPDTAVELGSRRYEAKGKIKVESKSDIKTDKSRPMAKSPDLADALAVLLDGIKHHGVLSVVSKARSTSNRDWERTVAEFMLDDDNSYTDDSVLAV